MAFEATEDCTSWLVGSKCRERSGSARNRAVESSPEVTNPSNSSRNTVFPQEEVQFVIIVQTHHDRLHCRICCFMDDGKECISMLILMTADPICTIDV